MLHPGKKKEGHGPQACCAWCVLSVQAEALGELCQSPRSAWHLWAAQDNLSTEGHLQASFPCSNFSLLGQGFHPITFPLQSWTGADASLGTQHSTAPSWPAQVVLGTSSLPFRHWDGPKSSQTSHMLTVAGLIARIKTIFFFSFQEGQVLIGLELETAPFAFHASHLVFMWGVVYRSYASGGRGLG